MVKIGKYYSVDNLNSYLSVITVKLMSDKMYAS